MLTQRDQRLAHAEGATTGVFRNLVGSAFMVPLALALGAGPVHIGLIGAAPAIGRLLQVALSGWISQLGARAATLWAGIGDRLIVAFVASLPFWLEGSPLAPWVIALSLSLSACCGELYNVAAAVWFAERTPAAERARFQATRTAWTQWLGLAANIGAGLLLYALAGGAGIRPRALGFSILTGSLAGLLGLAIISRIRPLPTPVRLAPQPKVRAAARLVLRDPHFRAFLRCKLPWGFAVHLGSPFLMAYAVSTLGFGVAQTAALTGVHLGTGALLLPFWGKVADRYGNHPVLVGCGFWAALAPLLWIALGGAETPYLIFLGEMVTGAAWSGVNLATSNALIKLAPPERRVSYVAVYTALAGVGTTAAPIVGGALLAWLAPLGTTTAFQILFALSGLLRLASVYTFRHTREAGARTLTHSSRALQRVGPRWMSPAGIGTAMLWLPGVVASVRRRVHLHARRNDGTPVATGSEFHRRRELL